MKIDLITETYPPDINGVALTVQSLHDGILSLGHSTGLIRPLHGDEAICDNTDLMLVDGAPIPRYPGLRFGLPASRRLTTRWTNQRPDAVYIATEGPLGWSALRTCQRLDIPAATGFHTRFDDYIGRYGAGFLAPWVFSWLRRFHNRGNATLVPTAQLRDELKSHGFKHVQHLARAVDTTRFDPRWRDEELRMQWGANQNTLVVIHVGRVAVEKNLPLLVQSFRAIEQAVGDAKLIIVGDGPARLTLAKQNPDFIFTGTLRGTALSRHFASADLFCFPSLSETFGNVTLEAMASGIATLAFDYGAAHEHLHDGLHGRRVAINDETQFVEAAVELANAGKDVLRDYGKQARMAVSTLSPDHVAREFARILLSIQQHRIAEAA